MKLQTQIPLSKANNQIDYESKLLLLGSCFSENIGAKLEYFKFRTLQNPFGILFHPLAIENLIQRAILNKEYAEKEVFNLNNQWLCFDAHSDLSSTSKDELLVNLNSTLQKTKQQIHTSNHIIITLGTAWVYKNISTNKIVANCHKVPQKEFKKELLSIAEIKRSLENIVSLAKSVNPKVQFIFTISPVRHLKDGFVENQRSKAHLIAAVQDLMPFRRSETTEKSNNDKKRFLPEVEKTQESQTLNVSLSGVERFPSYEIMMDELRDYRFYAKDMVHPNELAIEYIWEKFKYVWVSENAQSTMDTVDSIQNGLAHRPFNPTSEEHQKFKNSLQKKIKLLKKEFPFMEFGY